MSENEVVINFTGKDAGLEAAAKQAVQTAEQAAKKISSATAGVYNENAGYHVVSPAGGTNNSIAQSIQKAIQAERGMGFKALGSGIASAIAPIAGPAALAAAALTAVVVAGNKVSETLYAMSRASVMNAGASQASGTAGSSQRLRAMANQQRNWWIGPGFMGIGHSSDQLDEAAAGADFGVNNQMMMATMMRSRASEAAGLRANAGMATANARVLGLTNTADATIIQETAGLRALQGTAEASRQARINQINQETNSQKNSADSSFDARVRFKTVTGMGESDAIKAVTQENRQLKEEYDRRGQEQVAIVNETTKEMIAAETAAADKRMELARRQQDLSIKFASQESRTGLMGIILGNTQRMGGVGQAVGVQQSFSEATRLHAAGLMNDADYAAAKTRQTVGMVGAARQVYQDRFAFTSETMDLGGLGDRIASAAASNPGEAASAAQQAEQDRIGLEILQQELPGIGTKFDAMILNLQTIAQKLQTGVAP